MSKISVEVMKEAAQSASSLLESASPEIKLVLENPHFSLGLAAVLYKEVQSLKSRLTHLEGESEHAEKASLEKAPPEKKEQSHQNQPQPSGQQQQNQAMPPQQPAQPSQGGQPPQQHEQPPAMPANQNNAPQQQQAAPMPQSPVTTQNEDNTNMFSESVAQ